MLCSCAHMACKKVGYRQVSLLRRHLGPRESLALMVIYQPECARESMNMRHSTNLCLHKLAESVEST
jgi:hypothetical protein